MNLGYSWETGVRDFSFFHNQYIKLGASAVTQVAAEVFYAVQPDVISSSDSAPPAATVSRAIFTTKAAISLGKKNKSLYLH